MKKINVCIVGITGYTGEGLVDILSKHPAVNISCIVARSRVGEKLKNIYPYFKKLGNLKCIPFDADYIAKTSDVAFLALPHKVSMQYALKLIKLGVKVIDLSADYRFKDALLYKKVYNIAHIDSSSLKKSVYGLVELNKACIKKATILANPGCYPVASVLGLAPLVKKHLIKQDEVYIDAKSGFSGAGRIKNKDKLSEIKSNFKVYAVGGHRHVPEIESVLTGLAKKSIKIDFVAYLLPLERGMLVTSYVKLKNNKKLNLTSLYKRFYKTSAFVKVLPEGLFPELKDVVGTNFCHIGFKQLGKVIVIVSCIDNLVKGASGNAVENMNIMFGLKQTLGLKGLKINK
ncbi:MAG: N-acetyl-gamma-glutamyl-phosphate reductase [Candidatus Gygaella obscura]|nr:N-acetyl-gamma-glutamyl-phosphate reductase [Candidatus Gygaella obscura]